MHYRSLADLNAAVVAGVPRLPSGIDLVVGLPGGGRLAADLLGLMLDAPTADLEGLCSGRGLAMAHTTTGTPESRPEVVVIGDTAASDGAMGAVRARIRSSGIAADITFAAVFGSADADPDIDVVFEVVPGPVLLPWTVMHDAVLEQACVDIDGVLCADPTPEQNDDGPLYERFLREATPLWLPTRPIGHLVTSRLGRYRRLTQDWLTRWGVAYHRLHMLDCPSMAERQRLRLHGSFKAEIFLKTGAVLFIESEPWQAQEIARRSGKPVVCTRDFALVRLDASDRRSPGRLPSWWAGMPLTNRQALKQGLRSVVGEKGYAALKRRLRRSTEPG